MHSRDNIGRSNMIKEYCLDEEHYRRFFVDMANEGGKSLSSAFEEQVAVNSFGHKIRHIVSKNFGYQVIHVNTDTPLVSGYIAIATKILNDSGCPHTLEHMCFLGSKLIPYKGVLDKWANRAFARGTNAWTDMDETVYTVETLGDEGFINILPIYVDHVMHPLLTDSGCYTEVYNVDGEGKEAGVVFSEMLAVQNDAHEIMEQKAIKTLFPIESGLASETGGLPEALRSLTVEEIRKYHHDYYVPKNMCIVIVGKVGETRLNACVQRIDELLALYKKDFPKLPRPWMDQSMVTYPPKSISASVQFPDWDESMGSISVTWIGPDAKDFKLVEAIEQLSIYLTDSPVSPLMARFVEIAEPYCSIISFRNNRRSKFIISVLFDSVPVGKLDELQKECFIELERIASSDFNMARMNSILDRSELDLYQDVETSPSSFYSTPALFDFKYGSQDVNNYKEVFDSLHNLTELKKWSSKDWRNLLKKWLLDNCHVCVQGRPSANMAEQIKIETENRIKTYRETNGSQGLEELRRKLEKAREENDKPIPDRIIKSFTIPDVSKVELLDTKTARVGLANENTFCDNELQKQILADPDSAMLKSYIQLDNIESRFVEFRAYIGTNHLSKDLKLLVDIYFSYIFACPMMIDGKIMSYSDVVTRLDADLQQYEHDSSSAAAPEAAAIYLQCERARYELGAFWLRNLLFSPVFDPERMTVFVKKALQDIPAQKRNGHDLLTAVLPHIIYHEDKSTYRATELLAQEHFLENFLQELNSNPEQVEKQFYELKSKLFIPENIRIHISGRVTDVKKPLSVLREFPKAENQIISIAQSRNCVSERGRKPNGIATIVPSPCIESCESLHYTKGISDIDDPDLPALVLTIEYLEALEGLIWREIRGAGLAYGAWFKYELDPGLLYFSLYRAPDAFNAWKSASQSIRSLRDHPERIKEIELDSAKSVIVYKFGRMVSTGSKAAKQSFTYLSVLDRPKDYQKELLKKIMSTTKEEVIKALEKYLLKVFDPQVSDTLVVCSTAKKQDMISGFSQAQFRTEELNVFNAGDEIGDSDEDRSIAEDEEHEEADNEQCGTADDERFMAQALEQAKKSTPNETAYCVGCVIVIDGKVVASGYSRQLDVKCHAEQVALAEVASIDLSRATLYSTLEPCGHRTSGAMACAQRILNTNIKRVVYAAREPNDYVHGARGRLDLRQNGVTVVRVAALEKECLEIARRKQSDKRYVYID